MAPYNDFITSVSFLYSSDGGAAWSNIGPGALSATDTWTASWDTSGLPEGNKYRIKAIAYDSKGSAGEDISDANFSIVSKLVSGSTFLSGWNMFSFPLAPSSGSISSQLEDRLPTLFRIFRYNPLGRGYLQTDVASMGWGYWIKVNDDIDFEIKGLPHDMANFEVPLEAGWNMIGNPFRNSVNWGTILVRKDGVTKTVLEAQIAGWMSQWFYGYSPSTRSYEVNGDSDDKLLPFIGYWVKAYISGLTLIIPSS